MFISWTWIGFEKKFRSRYITLTTTIRSSSWKPFVWRWALLSVPWCRYFRSVKLRRRMKIFLLFLFVPFFFFFFLSQLFNWIRNISPNHATAWDHDRRLTPKQGWLNTYTRIFSPFFSLANKRWNNFLSKVGLHNI